MDLRGDGGYVHRVARSNPERFLSNSFRSGGSTACVCRHNHLVHHYGCHLQMQRCRRQEDGFLCIRPILHRARNFRFHPKRGFQRRSGICVEISNHTENFIRMCGVTCEGTIALVYNSVRIAVTLEMEGCRCCASQSRNTAL